MSSLSNYLKTHRKRLTLSQEEVGFLLGVKGESKGSKVSRNEDPEYVPGLHTAIAYAVIYGKPVRELFAGVYEQIEQEISERAKVLSYRTTGKPEPKRQEAITRLISKASN
jgi:transcriptional regulator with XRE-family HTH domain